MYILGNSLWAYIWLNPISLALFSKTFWLCVLRLILVNKKQAAIRLLTDQNKTCIFPATTSFSIQCVYIISIFFKPTLMAK